MSSHQPRVNAILLATDDARRVLLVRQTSGPFVGEWVLPGGGIEPGESLEEGLRREMREETGLEVSNLRRYARYEVRGIGERRFHHHVHAFRGRVQGRLRAEERSEAMWVRPSDLPLHPVLARELADGGASGSSRAELRDRLRALGVSMIDLGLSDDDRAWYDEVRESLEASYLAAPDAAAQSGKAGGMERWELGRKPIAAAIDRDGSFLDVGCANGLLMETLTAWAAERGHRLEPYGLELSEGLARLGRARYPRWSDRIFVGNALTWRGPRRFDIVRTELEYAPRYRAPELIDQLLTHVVARDGRLIVCGYGTDVAERVGDTLRRWGHVVAGDLEGKDREGHVLVRVAWIDAG